VKNHLSHNLRTLRNKRGLFQIDIADAIDIDMKAYAKYEEGRSEPNISSLIRLSEYYKITVDTLIKTKIK
jgi:transcriptional regulator with XRE-family HTH domain